jgi:hypothetical protein
VEGTDHNTIASAPAYWAAVNAYLAALTSRGPV